MHVAICDDNTADRKQLERLLSRESDKRLHTTGNLYVDSYGDPESMLKNPMQYDVFFIDMRSTEGVNNLDIVSSLAALGSLAPVVLCPLEEDERITEFADRILFLEKPVKVHDLSVIIDHAQSIKNDAKPKIELREERGGTYYVDPDDIMYAKRLNSCILVTLTNGQQVNHSSTMLSITGELEEYTQFFTSDVNTIINARHIKDINLFTIIMEDNTKFISRGKYLAYAKRYFEEYTRAKILKDL